jgi:hypothetical protein
MPEREIVEPFASDPAHRRETSAVRGTWLASSLRALRDRELIERYRAELPAQYHDAVFASAGQWLPVEVAVAHYAAIDRLELPAATAVAMGSEIQGYATSLMIRVAVRMSREAGITPWTAIGQFRKIWDRMWRGGDLQIVKVGPKEAEMDIVGWSIASSPYVHHSMRGVLEGAAAPFCTKAYAREIRERSGGTSVAFRVAWV